MRIVSTIIVVLMSCSSCFPCFAQANLSCEHPSAGPCSANVRGITEIPQGAIDGHNALFILSHTPWDEFVVHVLVNDRQLVRGQEFSIYHERLSFTQSAIPRPGDTVTVTYPAVVQPSTPATNAPASSLGLQSSAGIPTVEAAPKTVNSTPTLTSPSKVNQSDMILRDALLRAVDDEQIAYYERKSSVRRSDPPATSRVNSQRSLDLLEKTLQGVEGTGDEQTLSPFDVLLGLSKPSTSIDQLTKAPSQRNISPDSSFRSIRMLADTLDKARAGKAQGNPVEGR
jgi:hypothetical protein